MKPLLLSIGLSDLQAETYLHLIAGGNDSPPKLAKELGMTRSNAYKVLDSLEELGLVSKSELNKKFIYQASELSALSDIVARKRNEVIALEHNTQNVIQELRKLQGSRTNNTKISLQKGKKAMLSAYESQAKAGQAIHFVKTRADITFLGFEAMDRVRKLVAGTKIPRYGITPDAVEAPINPKIDKKTNLHRTWMPSEAYTSPVEWTVSADKLLIQVFDNEGRVIEINDAQVAESFRQLWKLLDSGLKSSPKYSSMPRSARREI